MAGKEYKFEDFLHLTVTSLQDFLSLRVLSKPGKKKELVAKREYFKRCEYFADREMRRSCYFEPKQWLAPVRLSFLPYLQDGGHDRETFYCWNFKTSETKPAVSMHREV